LGYCVSFDRIQVSTILATGDGIDSPIDLDRCQMVACSWDRCVLLPGIRRGIVGQRHQGRGTEATDDEKASAHGDNSMCCTWGGQRGNVCPAIGNWIIGPDAHGWLAG
jgi:hypothetical protein